MNNDNNYYYHDDQDIFDLIKLFWGSKFIILSITLIGLLVSTIFVNIKQNSFVSIIEFKTSTIPPSMQKKSSKQLLDFQKLFFNEETFNDWKLTVKKTSLSYDHISNTDNYNGFLVSKSIGERVIVFDKDNIIIKSNNLSFINEIFNYLIYVNNTLSNYYLQESINELEQVKKEYGSFDKMLIGYSAFIDVTRFIAAINNGSKIFVINRPTYPSKTSKSSSSIILISFFSSFVLGVLFVLFLNGLKNHKAKTLKMTK